MKNLVTGSQMKAIDSYTIHQIGIPSVVLMERAALSVAEEMQRRIGREERIWAVCGTGNNGADGVAAARILHLRGYHVIVVLAGDPKHRTAECRVQIQIAENLGMNVIPYSDFIPGKCEVLIDALFGVGLSREIEGEYLEIMELLAEVKPRFTVSVDIPSGIHGDNGQVMGMALQADLTVTFGYEKTGCALYPGVQYAGEIVVADIGFPAFSGGEIHMMNREDLEMIPLRRPDANKGTYGKVLIVAGSVTMCGAAYLSALAAYRTGAGLVRILTVEENRAVLQQQLPEAILTTYSSHEFQAEKLEEAVSWASVIVLGPGLGRDSYVKPLVEWILSHARVPLVLDADGLNTVSTYPELADYFTEHTILTPHPGEMARLTGQSVEMIKKNLLGTAKTCQERYGVTCVLKDARTVTAANDGHIYINSSGSSAMAKAGSGDVLTGVIAGLLALGLEEAKAAPLAVLLHGLAGEEAAKRCGEHGILARDIAECICQICRPQGEERR